MGKKIVCIGLLMVFVFSIAGCTNLESYKTNAKVKLDNYISKLPDSFRESLPTFERAEAKNHINGFKIDKIVSEGKAAIDKASNKKGVNRALSDAKKEFDTIPIVFPRSQSDRTIDGETESFGFQFLFYLKMFEQNITYECTGSVGTIHSFPRSDEPLSPDYDGFFGRQPQIVRWFVECVLLNPSGFDVLFMQDFIDFIVKNDDAIIGYIVVEMNFIRTTYVPKLLASVVNPKINGEYQAMDENQVKAEIESIKNKND